MLQGIFSPTIKPSNSNSSGVAVVKPLCSHQTTTRNHCVAVTIAVLWITSTTTAPREDRTTEQVLQGPLQAPQPSRWTLPNMQLA